METIKRLSHGYLKIKVSTEQIKKSHAKAIELKTSEIKDLKEQNDYQKEKIDKMEAQIEKMNSSLKE